MSAPCCARPSLCLLELHLDEGELAVAGIDDVMLDARLAEVGDAGGQLGERFLAVVADDGERAAGQRHDDVVEFVAVEPGLAARREAPQRDPRARVVFLDIAGRLGHDGTPSATGNATIVDRRRSALGARSEYSMEAGCL